MPLLEGSWSATARKKLDQLPSSSHELGFLCSAAGGLHSRLRLKPKRSYDFFFVFFSCSATDPPTHIYSWFWVMPHTSPAGGGYGGVGFHAVRPHTAAASSAKRRAAILAALVAVLCVTALAYVGVSRQRALGMKASQELSEDEALIREDATALRDSKRLENAAWLAQQYAAHPQMKGLTAQQVCCSPCGAK